MMDGTAVKKREIETYLLVRHKQDLVMLSEMHMHDVEKKFQSMGNKKH